MIAMAGQSEARIGVSFCLAVVRSEWMAIDAIVPRSVPGWPLVFNTMMDYGFARPMIADRR